MLVLESAKYHSCNIELNKSLNFKVFKFHRVKSMSFSVSFFSLLYFSLSSKTPTVYFCKDDYCFFRGVGLQAQETLILSSFAI